MADVISEDPALDDHCTWNSMPEPVPELVERPKGGRTRKTIWKTKDPLDRSISVDDDETRSGTPWVKGNWSAEEDAVLLRLVEEERSSSALAQNDGITPRSGSIKWAMVAQQLPGRVGKQCRERYENHLRPNLNKGRWTAAEELIVYTCVLRWGHQWASISRLLKSRSDNRIKNHWNCHMLRRLERDEQYALFMKTAFHDLDLTPFLLVEEEERIIVLSEPLPEIFRTPVKKSRPVIDRPPPKPRKIAPKEPVSDPSLPLPNLVESKLVRKRQRKSRLTMKKRVKPALSPRPAKIKIHLPPKPKKAPAPTVYSKYDLVSPRKSYRTIRKTSPEAIPIPRELISNPRARNKAPKIAKKEIPVVEVPVPVEVPVQQEEDHSRNHTPEIASRDGKPLVLSADDVLHKAPRNLLAEAPFNVEALLRLTALTAPTVSYNPLHLVQPVLAPPSPVIPKKLDFEEPKNASELTPVMAVSQPEDSVRKSILKNPGRPRRSEPKEVIIKVVHDLPVMKPSRPVFRSRTFPKKRSKTTFTAHRKSAPAKRVVPKPLFSPVAKARATSEPREDSPVGVKTEEFDDFDYGVAWGSRRRIKPKVYDDFEVEADMTDFLKRKRWGRDVYPIFKGTETMEEIEKSLPPPLPEPELVELLCSEDEMNVSDTDL